MKVLNLQCAHQHPFEGWFGSEDDYTSQLERGLVTCPLCGDARIQKKLSAPRLNLRAAHSTEKNETDEGLASAAAVPLRGQTPDHHPEVAALQARVLHALREAVAHAEDVGERFADEARAMHHGEVAHRHIRGQSSPREALELLEEGIDVLPLALLPAIKETLQ